MGTTERLAALMVRLSSVKDLKTLTGALATFERIDPRDFPELLDLIDRAVARVEGSLVGEMSLQAIANNLGYAATTAARVIINYPLRGADTLEYI